MSFNLSTRLNNLYQLIQNIQTTALTNPMVANLNMASFSVNNATSVNAPASAPLILSADPAQGIVVNTKMTIPNHPLTITNNTVNDSLQVGDSAGDSSIFRVDTDGNVAVKANPATALTSDFTVNGSASITGNLTSGGTITAVSVNAGNVINNITNGLGIIKSGSSTNPTISTNLTAGAGISLTPGAGTTLQVASTVVIPPQGKLSRIGLVGNTTSPVSGGTLGYQSITILAGAFNNDIIAGTSPDPNGVWVFDLNPITLQLTGFLNSGVVNIGFGNSIDAGVYYNTAPNNSSFGSPPTTNATGVRNGSCPPFIVKVSDLIATCPNMATGLTRLYFQNQSTDTMWVQTTPSIVIGTYFPNGVE
jgi:hypothetical protein